jgi:hypothetical protein
LGQEVKIKIRAFPYYVDVEDPLTGEDRRIEQIARRGDVVELSDKDLERAKRFDAVVDPDEDVPEPGPQPPPGDTVEGLAEWLRTEKPSVQEVLDRADGDPELAEKLIEAENLASGQQPRQNLVDKLKKQVAKGGA